MARRRRGRTGCPGGRLARRRGSDRDRRRPAAVRSDGLAHCLLVPGPGIDPGLGVDVGEHLAIAAATEVVERRYEPIRVLAVGLGPGQGQPQSVLAGHLTELGIEVVERALRNSAGSRTMCSSHSALSAARVIARPALRRAFFSAFDGLRRLTCRAARTRRTPSVRASCPRG